MKISEFLLQTLEHNGVSHIFGNPGTTELPLVKACEQGKKLKYVVALSEVSAVPMADGYARATRSLGVVNLHVAPGLGNGMGTLYTAGIAGTPLLPAAFAYACACSERPRCRPAWFREALAEHAGLRLRRVALRPAASAVERIVGDVGLAAVIETAVAVGEARVADVAAAALGARGRTVRVRALGRAAARNDPEQLFYLLQSFVGDGSYFLTVQHPDSSLSAHYCNFGSRPCIVQVAT